MQLRLLTEFQDVPLKVVVPVLLAAFAAALLFVLWTYRRTRRVLQPPWFRTLLVIRLLAVFVLFLCVVKPVLVEPETVPRRGRVAVFLDNTGSMARTKDSLGGRARLDAAREFLFGSGNVLDGVRKRFHVNLYAFGNTAKPIQNEQDLGEPDEVTNLGDVLDTINRLAGAGGLDGAVIVTDGANTAGQPGELLVRELRVPVHCVGVGEKGAPTGTAPDVAIADIVAKRTMFAGTRTTVNFTVAKRNVPRGSVRVVATDGTTPIGETTIELTGAEGTERFSMEITPIETGPRRFTLTATTLDDERIVANNARSFSAAVKEPSLKVLYFEGRPRWEFKYLRRTLEETPDLQLASVVRTAAESFYVQGDLDVDLSGGLPDELAALNTFNVIVLGSGGTEVLDDADVANLAAYVEGGKGLVVLGTEDVASFKNTPLEKVLPLHLEKGRNPERFELAITAEGQRHPILAGIADTLDADPALRTLQGRILTGRQRGGATVLAWARSNLPRSDGAEPALAVQNYGKGRCLFITADNTWRWHLNLQQRGDESTYATFWLQAIRWAAEFEPGEKAREFPIAAWTDKDYYDPGEEVEITLEAEASLDTIAAVLKRRGANLGPLQWTPARQSLGGGGVWEDKPNAYTAVLEPADIDEYEIAITYGVETRSLHFAVGDPLAELMDTGLNESLLRQLAARSGARCFDLTQGAELIDALRHPTRQTLAARAALERGIWDTPWPFLVFVALCSAEWFIRRWKQLT
ncbi:MAG: hypothetical protein JW889_08995 [Verrucomicrobia bacterium]|nr:hypothetical protein [Verrucomicrobiota bacterium]